ncbi:MAG: autotransporter outer membrane beta-barrel domain-containing protein [Fusobacteriaceae bacterium]
MKNKRLVSTLLMFIFFSWTAKSVNFTIDDIRENEKLYNFLIKLINFRDDVERDRAFIQVTGELYANIPRQMRDINKTFKLEEQKFSTDISEKKWHISIFDQRRSIVSDFAIPGYDEYSAGFIGGYSLDYKFTVTAGYQYANYEYEGPDHSKINSLHLGIYKVWNPEEYNILLGLNGDYDFNSFNRDISLVGKLSDGDFGSYIVNFNAGVSKIWDKLGETNWYIFPRFILDIGYGSRGSFAESGASEYNLASNVFTWLSIEPTLGTKLGYKYSNMNFYTDFEYVYTIGTMEKRQIFKLNNLPYRLQRPDLNKSSYKLLLGSSFEFDPVTLIFEAGKKFQNGEDLFVTGKIGLKF